MPMLPAANSEARREMAMDTVLRHIDRRVSNWESCCAPVMQAADLNKGDVQIALRHRAVMLAVVTPAFLPLVSTAHCFAGFNWNGEACASALASIIAGYAYFITLNQLRLTRCHLRPLQIMILGTLANLSMYATLFFLLHSALPPSLLYGSNRPDVGFRLICSFAFWLPALFIYRRLARPPHVRV